MGEMKEGYPSSWKHATIHLDPESGEMHSDGDHSVRHWIAERLAEKRRIAEKLELLLGIETLEYHDMNFLSGDNKRRNETKRAMLKECIEMAGGGTDAASI